LLLPDEIRHAIGADAHLWYPGLAANLIEDFDRKHRAQGWCRDSYSTGRWIAGDVLAPRVQLGVVRAGSHRLLVEALPPVAIRAVEGLPSLSESPLPSVEEQMQAAVDRVTLLDGLPESLGWLIGSCHVLAAERGYDVSHSTPALPLSIFVSVPGPDERHAELRLAESIIHEAMHLQLTFIESHVSLVEPTGATVFSPWKQTDRPVQGVLHGLYVFAVIHEALATLAAKDFEARDYANARRPEIAADIAAIGDARESLTPDGTALWNKLMSRVAVLE
jgi:hypothetical protein